MSSDTLEIWASQLLQWSPKLHHRYQKNTAVIKNKFHLWEDTSKHSDTALHYESKIFYPNPLRFSEFFPYCWELLSKILHAYCVLIYGKLKNCIQLSLKLTKIRHIKHNHPVNFHFSNLLHRKEMTSLQRMNGHQSHQTSTHLTIMCGVQCFRHFTNFTQSQRPFRS